MSNSTDIPDEKTREARFANALYALSKRSRSDGSSRATLARLRRTLGRRSVDAIAYREVGSILPANLTDRERDIYVLVAAIYAVHAAKSESPWFGGYVGSKDGFGISCKKLRGNSGSMDTRFSALLDARFEDLPYRLRQAVSLLAAPGNEVGVRYDKLLDDLLNWDLPGRPVQRKWTIDYWT